MQKISISGVPYKTNIENDLREMFLLTPAEISIMQSQIY